MKPLRAWEIQRRGLNPGDYYRWRSFYKQFGEPAVKAEGYFFYIDGEHFKCFSAGCLRWFNVEEREDGQYLVVYPNGRKALFEPETSELLRNTYVEHLLIGD
jgi:hypothetical protein